ncbi:MAG: hypothetical protein U0800_11195 [Isosphaeraceae bacterium]
METRMAPGLFFRLAASVYRHRADDRADALARALPECARAGGRNRLDRLVVLCRCTPQIDGHRIHAGDSAALGDAMGSGSRWTTRRSAQSFRTGSRLIAAEALDRLRRIAPGLPTALVSTATDGEVAGLAIGLGFAHRRRPSSGSQGRSSSARERRDAWAVLAGIAVRNRPRPWPPTWRSTWATT